MSGAGLPKRKVCILGAGPSGLSAAWELTDPTGPANVEVHVYQMGWRAGGRAASARNPSAGYRIEQNGSHYLFGSYHNTFKLVRAVYKELGAKRPFGRMEDEFTPRNLLVGKRTLPEGGFEDWFQFMPTNLSRPGRGGKYARPFDYLWMLLQTVLRMALGIFDFGDDPALTARWVAFLFPLSPFKQDSESADRRCAVLRVFLFAPALIVNYPVAWLVGAGWKALSFCYERLLNTYTKRRLQQAALRWFNAQAVVWRARIRKMWAALRDLVARESLGKAWMGRIDRLKTLWELAFGIMVGIGADELWRPGRMERIDEEDFRGWLARHACAREAFESPYVKCWYDAIAAYEDGDTARPSISAAVSVYAIVRAILTYKGNFAYQMRHEVGDGVIAPLVAALRQRGVRFHFFHRVRDVVPGRDANERSVIERIELEPQLPDGVEGGDLFVTHSDGRLGWPYEPLLEGRADSIPTAKELESFYTRDTGRRVLLRRGEDFDDVVFALPLPAIAHDAPSLVQQPRWRTMLDRVKTTDTMSLRIWFRWSLEDLGWKDPGPILSGYNSAFSTWEDNCHNLDHTSFPAGQEPNAIATVFGPLPAPTFAPGPGPEGDAYLQSQQTLAEAKRNEFYDSGIKPLWPQLVNSAKGDELHYEAFCDLSAEAAAPEAGGRRRLDWQLLRVNVGPLERYTLALPSTSKDRLRPDESGYVNMSLAGEWTRNGVEVGCMEGAVISGMAAARALSGRPAEILGEHDLEFGLFAPVVKPKVRGKARRRRAGRYTPAPPATDAPLPPSAPPEPPPAAGATV